MTQTWLQRTELPANKLTEQKPKKRKFESNPRSQFTELNSRVNAHLNLSAAFPKDSSFVQKQFLPLASRTPCPLSLAFLTDHPLFFHATALVFDLVSTS
jgi:hypothetical protein